MFTNAYVIAAAIVGIFSAVLFCISFIFFVAKNDAVKEYEKQLNEIVDFKQVIDYLEDFGIHLMIIPGVLRTNLKYVGTTFQLSKSENGKLYMADFTFTLMEYNTKSPFRKFFMDRLHKCYGVLISRVTEDKPFRRGI